MARKLIAAGPAEKCEAGCGKTVRVAQYEGGKPNLREVPERPGGRHTPERCQDARGVRR